MGVAAYTTYAAAHVALTVLALRQASRARTWTIVVVLVLSTTLAYDNVMLVMGASIGEGDLLLALSRPRFVIHALVTPVSIAVVVDQAGRLGVAWARGARARLMTWGLVAAMVALGVADLLGLDLVAERGLGLLHYTSAEPSVPIPAVVSVVAMIVAGWSVRRSTGWSALFTLGIVAFVGSAVPPIDGMLLLGNLVEVAFVAALLLAEQRATAPAPTFAPHLDPDLDPDPTATSSPPTPAPIAD